MSWISNHSICSPFAKHFIFSFSLGNTSHRHRNFALWIWWFSFRCTVLLPEHTGWRSRGKDYAKNMEQLDQAEWTAQGSNGTGKPNGGCVSYVFTTRFSVQCSVWLSSRVSFIRILRKFVRWVHLADSERGRRSVEAWVLVSSLKLNLHHMVRCGPRLHGQIYLWWGRKKCWYFSLRHVLPLVWEAVFPPLQAEIKRILAEWMTWAYVVYWIWSAPTGDKITLC